VVAQAKADRLGAFEMTPPPLAAGVHRLELAAKSDGAPLALSAPVEIDVPKGGPNAPALSSTPLEDHSAMPTISSDSKPASIDETTGSLSAAPSEADRPGEPEAIAPAANLRKMRLLPRTGRGAEASRSAHHLKAMPSSEPMPAPRADRPRGSASR
jgi:hypothetical protein